MFVCVCVITRVCVYFLHFFTFHSDLNFFLDLTFLFSFLKTILCSSDKLPEVTSYKVEYSYI